MPERYIIILDTNYIRSLGVQEYQSGRVPEKFRIQLERATYRGDTIVIVDTVRTEINAFLATTVKQADDKLYCAFKLLTSQGYSVSPAFEYHTSPEMLEIIRRHCPKCVHEMPLLEDYREAERRTSFRLHPLPHRAEAEEMRDRIIWCQAVRIAKSAGQPILIISNDDIFANGAQSEEGKSAKITAVRTETDLDQRLGERPANIQKVVDRLLVFADQLREQGINLSAETIYAIEDLRNKVEEDGSITQRFTLILADMVGIRSPIVATVTVMGEQVVRLSLSGERQIDLIGEFDQEQATNDAQTLLLQSWRAIRDLQAIVRGTE